MAPTPSPDFVTIRYRKVVGLGLAFQAINFAQGEFMGHRVRLTMPVDYMNQYFFWERAKGDYRPTGRFADAGHALFAMNDQTVAEVADLPSFVKTLEWALGTEYTDIDGVADALNYSSEALDTYNESKRDGDVINYASPLNLVNGTSPTNTHYGANDLVMAYVLAKCFGSSAFDAQDIIYNLEDAFGMLSSKALAEAVRDSLKEQDDLAAQVLEAEEEPKLGQRGKVDDMFRALLAADPKRFFFKGTQIEGLFETNFVGNATDASGDRVAAGNWCLKQGDVIEVPIKLFFTAPVTVLSVVDNPKEPSSDSPANPETVFIKGEAGADEETPYDPNAEDAAVANRANTMSIRLQLMCGKPLNAGGRTFATSEVMDAAGTAVAELPLKITNQMNLVFYNSPYYPAQSAIAVVAAGGDSSATYVYDTSGTDLMPAGLNVDANTGVFAFNRLGANGAPLSPAPVSGRYPITVNITCGDEVVSTEVFVSIDNGMGSSNTDLNA